MKVTLGPGVLDAMRNLPPAPKKEIRDALRRLAVDPFDDGLDWKPLVGPGPNRYLRLRVGSYRIAYTITATHVFVDRIMHRREGYGWLERL